MTAICSTSSGSCTRCEKGCRCPVMLHFAIGETCAARGGRWRKDVWGRCGTYQIEVFAMCSSRTFQALVRVEHVVVESLLSILSAEEEPCEEGECGGTDDASNDSTYDRARVGASARDWDSCGNDGACDVGCVDGLSGVVCGESLDGS
jgi:hypothetical protein